MTTYFTQLGNGMRVVTEHVPHVESVSLGIWLVKGSRHELAQENGMFHFIEHTLFKGTPTWSARKIAEAFDGIGGSLDAHTGKEETCFSFRLRAKHLNFGMNILGEMLRDPAFEAVELDRERQVILEEIKMAADDPEDLAFESAMQAFWGDHPLGRPILGRPELVQGFQPAQVKHFHQVHYQPEQMIVAAAGKLDHDALLKMLEHHFPTKATEALDIFRNEPPKPKGFSVHIDRPHLEQATFCLIYPGLNQNHPQMPALALLCTLLGGGMSSRLFQTIREEHGLAYSVGAFFGAYQDAGYVSIYGSCSPENLEKVLVLVEGELEKLRDGLVDEMELQRAREQCIGGMVLGLEHSAARAGALAKAMQYGGNIFDLQQQIEKLQKVICEDIQHLAKDLLTQERMGHSVVGPLEKTHLVSLV